MEFNGVHSCVTAKHFLDEQHEAAPVTGTLKRVDERVYRTVQQREVQCRMLQITSVCISYLVKIQDYQNTVRDESYEKHHGQQDEQDHQSSLLSRLLTSVASFTFVITDRVVEVKTIDDLRVAKGDHSEWNYGENDKQTISVDHDLVVGYTVKANPCYRIIIKTNKERSYHRYGRQPDGANNVGDFASSESTRHDQRFHQSVVSLEGQNCHRQRRH